MVRMILTFLLAAAALSASAPNIVLITMDTTREDHLSLYGYAEKTSPNIDAAGHEGRVFTRAYSIVPLTFPAHTVILTGRTPFENEIFLNGQKFKPGPDYLTTVLKQRHYATAAFVSSAILDHNFGLDKDFDTYSDMMALPKMEKGERPERSAADTTALAVDWLRKAPKPFFLWVHYFDPHAPYTPPKPYLDAFKLPYDGEIAAMDASIGVLLKALPKETLVLMTGDHGEMLGEHGEEEHGVLLYQPAVHIPMIVKGPGVKPGVEEAPVCILDLYPTIVAAAGGKVPEGMQGRSLLSPGDAARPIIASSLYGREIFGFYPSLAAIQSDTKLLDYGERDFRLFDLAKDPKETDNQFLTQRPKVKEMKKLTDEVKFPGVLSIAIQAEDQKKLTALGYSSPRQIDRLVHPEEGLKYEKVFQDAKAKMENGHMEDAAVLLENLLNVAPYHTEARTTLGKLYMKLGRQTEAREVFAGIANRESANPRSHLQLGNTLANQNEPEKAVQEYKVALTLDPRLAEAYGALARIYYMDKDAAALDALEANAKQYSIENSELYAYLGFRALDRKDPERATQLFQDARELDAKNPLPLKGLANMTMLRGDKAKALEQWKEYLALAPRDPEANYYAGVLVVQTGGTKEEALQFLKQALETCPGPKFCDMVKQAIGKIEKQ